jgi:hypothetical protein
MFCGACGLGFGTLEQDAPDAGESSVVAVTPVLPAVIPAVPAATPVVPAATPVIVIPTPPAPPANPSAPRARPAAAPTPPPSPTSTRAPSATMSLGRVRSRRRAVNSFVRVGALLAAIGILLPLLGAPRPATGLAPLGSAAMPGQPLDYVPLLAVGVLVVIALASVAAWTRDLIDAGPALTITAVAGIGMIVLAVLTAGRLGYDAVGGVLPAVSFVVAGGASILASALVGAMIRE